MILRNDVVFPLVAALIVFLGMPCAAQDTTKAPASAITAVQPAKDSVQKGTAPAKAAASLQKKKMVEEEIISEDEEMLIPEKGVPQPVKKEQPQPAKADTAAAKAAVQTTADTSKAGAPAAVQEVVGGDSAKTDAAPVADTSVKASVVQAPAVPAKPAKIEEARSINFAKNLKEYRSPKVAMLMSLFIPGLGQAYIKNYWRAGLYVAAEAAIIGVSVVFMNKGKDKYKEATAFADKNFSTDSMKAYYNNLYQFLRGNTGSDSGAQEALDVIYGNDTLLKNFSQASAAKTQEFYRTIADKAYTQGWNDCEPSLAEILSENPEIELQPPPEGYQNRYYRYADTLGLSYLVNIKNKDNNTFIENGEAQYGYSLYQRTFSSLMSQSNENYKTATNILFVILVNHVVSAVDALISAKMYNDNLLGKQSFWHHIEVEPGVAGRDMITAPGLTMRVRF